MTLSLSEIKVLNSIDLENYEIRGAKPGVNNARTTGPLYVSGTYEPDRNDLSGDASFVSDSSIVTNISFDAPYASFDASVFNPDDRFFIDSTQFLIQSIKDSSSVELNEDSGFDGTHSFTTLLGTRDYLVEPDKFNNTFTGNATFTKDSSVVIGIGTLWVTDLTANDFIKRDDYQFYYRIGNVVSNTELHLVSNFGGTTGVDSYTAKKQRIGQMYVRYTKDDFEYQKNGAFWEVDETTGSKILTSTSFSPLADGIELRFTRAINPNDPDLMDTDTVLNKVLANETDREIFQFALPVVPNPEETLELFINDVKKDRFPSGNQDYVVNYHPDPIFLPPPLPAERQVANILFLDGISNIDLSPADTQTGAFNVVDSDGNQVAGIMPGSETIMIDGTTLDLYKDYVIDSGTGIIFSTESHTNEALVDSVGVNIRQLIDYGIKTTLDGQELIYTIPPSNDDEVRIVLNTGRVVPSDKDHPSPGEEYLVEYQVESDQRSETVTVTSGMTVFRLSRYPVKDNSVIITKNDIILEENEDYRVSYQTGRIILFQPLQLGDGVSVTYIPLSLQQNGITYEDGKSFCTVYDSRLNIRDESQFIFQLVNPNLAAENISLIGVFNHTRSAYYDIAGAQLQNSTITLSANSTNIGIGLDKNDIVTSDYKFEHDGLEYAPVLLNNFTILEDSTNFYLINQDSTSYFPSGALIRVTPSDAARNYYFTVVSSAYDGEDTIVTFDGAPPEDVINPFVYVSDASVSFDLISSTASNITSGIDQISFPDVNIPNLFRLGSVLKVGNDAYSVNEATFEDGTTTVTLQADVANDYTSASILSSIKISRTPFYVEGSTTLIPSDLIVTDPAQPAMSLTSVTSNSYSLSSDASKLTITSDSSVFNFGYDFYPTISDLSGGIVSFIPSISISDYVPDWTSSKIIPSNNIAILPDNTSIVSIAPALRLDGVDTTAFEITNGLITLTNGLESGQRYNIDYQGQEYLGNSQVNVSARYFSTLAAGSKISASFEYDNLDQFYIQVMSQRYFLENVIEPRQEEEANQNLGNVGQGGDIPGDEDQGNAEGGLVDNEFRRRDAEIECRVYEQIYDFFSDRAQAFGDELYAAVGFRLLNNDGLLDKTEQSMGTKTFNRMFPPDYTNLEPSNIAALTGQTNGPGNAVFVNGQTGVNGTGGTIWSKQLESGDFIRPKDTSEDLHIASIESDSSISLSTAFSGTSSSASGEEFILTAGLPLFDDDGFMGAKIDGTKSSDFGLVQGDRFDATINGDATFCKFTDPFTPFFSGSQIAQTVNFQIPKITMSYEQIYDPNTVFGIRNVLVIRTDGTNNCITLGDSTVTSKLGFVAGDYQCGNLDNVDGSGEYTWDIHEGQLIDDERSYLDLIIAAGTPFKLDRTDSTSLGYALQVRDIIAQELTDMSREQEKINEELQALSHILQETDFPAYTDSLAAYNDATQFQSDTSVAMAYASSILADWEGRGDATNWVLDYTSTRQDILYKDPTTNIGYDSSPSGSGYIPIQDQSSFILQVPPSGDRRILNLGPDQTPVINYIIDDSTVDGTWIGWDPTFPVLGRYSINNDMTFNADGTFTGSLYVDYQTISDELLSDRTDFLTDRSSQLTDRVNFLFLDSTSREDQIRQHLIDEELFRSLDGSYGNLYVWADNRFNRSGGCEARLKQIESLIQLAQNNLAINRRFL